MLTAGAFRFPVLACCLAVGACLGLPDWVTAACGCGPNCPCGTDCQCGQPLKPPPVNPDANPVRKNQSALTAQEQQDFVNAVLQLKHTYRPGETLSVYDQYVHAHMTSMTNYQSHEGPAFFPWHRQFVRSFELELQAVHPSVTIPYWDFTVDNKPTSSLWSGQFMGGNGDPNDNWAVKDGPFRQGEWVLAFDGPDLRRNLGYHAETLPTAAEVQTGLGIGHYDVFPFDPGSDVGSSFRNYMEGWNSITGESEMHNRVHEWVGGSMLTMVSPNDPIFWLLHANLDRLWAEWEELHGYDYPLTGAPPGHNLYDPMEPFGVTPAGVLDHHALGYFYDTETGATPEPDTLLLLCAGATCVVLHALRGRRKAA